MGLLSGRRVRTKKFEYEPRYYDPSRDNRLRHRMQIRSKSKPRGRRQSALTLGIIFILVMLIYLSV